MLSHEEQITYGKGWVEAQINTIAAGLGQNLGEIFLKQDDSTYFMATRPGRPPANVDVSIAELEDLHAGTAADRDLIRERIRKALTARPTERRAR